MGEHPLPDLVEDQRVAAGGIVRRVPVVRMVLVVQHPQPWRDPERVGGLLGAQDAEVLVLEDQPLQGAARHDVRVRQLLLHAGPAAQLRGAGGAAGRQGAQDQAGDDDCCQRCVREPAHARRDCRSLHWVSSNFRKVVETKKPPVDGFV